MRQRSVAIGVACIALIAGVVVVVKAFSSSRGGTANISAEAFESIRTGMTEAEVFRLVGAPDLRGTPQDTGQEWLYKSSAMFPQYFYHVIIKDGLVVKTRKSAA